MKIAFFSIMLMLQACTLSAQDINSRNTAEDNTFKCTLYEADHNLVLRINFYDKNVKISGQEFMGEMSGYIDDEKDFRNWLIVSSEIINTHKATMQVIDDECNLDFDAELVYNPEDGIYTFKQLNGAVLRVARNRKWEKLPKTLIFTQTRTPTKK